MAATSGNYCIASIEHFKKIHLPNFCSLHIHVYLQTEIISNIEYKLLCDVAAIVSTLAHATEVVVRITRTHARTETHTDTLSEKFHSFCEQFEFGLYERTTWTFTHEFL